MLSDDQRRRVNEAVADAEARTSAEIVPVLARESGRYDRSEDMCGLVVMLMAITTAWLLFQGEAPEKAGWNGFALSLSLPWVLVIAAVSFIGGVVLAMHVGWLRRLFTPRREMHEEVTRAARTMFFDRRVHHTTSATGVLLYVSLFERRAVVLADRGALEALGQATLDEVCVDLTTALRTGDVAGALCGAIGALGDRLAEPLPRAEDVPNELPNALVIVTGGTALD